jgi:hypothetical protein
MKKCLKQLKQPSIKLMQTVGGYKRLEIIGGVIISLLTVICILLMVYLLRKRKCATKDSSTQSAPDLESVDVVDYTPMYYYYMYQ